MSLIDTKIRPFKTTAFKQGKFIELSDAGDGKPGAAILALPVQDASSNPEPSSMSLSGGQEASRLLAWV